MAGLHLRISIGILSISRCQCTGPCRALNSSIRYSRQLLLPGNVENISRKCAVRRFVRPLYINSNMEYSPTCCCSSRRDIRTNNEEEIGQGRGVIARNKITLL